MPEKKISEASFEAANIVLYTKDADFFLNNNGIIKKVVDDIKKRIELRPDTSILLEQEEAEKKIRQLMPEEAGVSSILFDPQRSIVVIAGLLHALEQQVNLVRVRGLLERIKVACCPR